ncbi:AbrB/MazE/SpoVT family DNA-binding domain-containing protein [Candidatus Peregrinibacteria bacterium]|nr:AbrB/MazE/SpoVT family DNA-binding domain-containing protein [Candidatus Peregrinibacteria bacterium]
MQNISTAKIFGTGQVTLPKKWRDKIKTRNIIIEEVPQGLLIKPLTESFYYEMDDISFGINFPLGIKAENLAKELKKANAGLS